MNNHVFLDIEIVLDLAISSRKGHRAAIELLDAVENDSLRASVCATDLPRISSELEGFMGADDALLYMQALVEALDVATVDEAVCKQALALGEGSFTTRVLQVCAEKANADYVITSNPAAFKKSNIKAIDATKFIQTVRS